MDVAVGIDGYRLATETDADLWGIAIIKVMNCKATRGLKAHKADVVLGCHRVWISPYVHSHRMGRGVGDDRHVLLVARLNGVRLKQRHLLATANRRYATVDSSNKQVAA